MSNNQETQPSGDWQDTLLRSEATINDAVQILDKVSLRIVLIVDSLGKLIGTVTDGDVRRGLIDQIGMDKPVGLIMNKNPITVFVGQNRSSILALMKKWDILQIPVVEENGKVVHVEFLQGYTNSTKLENPVVLMAGGYGKRLYPLTIDVPKPMLKIGNKPILESIVEQVSDSGFHNLYISIHYKGDVVKDYFGNGSAWGVDIEYLIEEEPLGTAGAVRLLPEKFEDLPILLVNGDILTKVDFRRLLEFHEEQKSQLTMGVREFDYQVPYGVVEVSDLSVKTLIEKPVYHFFVNAGIYIFRRQLIDEQYTGESVDMTDIVNAQLQKRSSVNAYPIHEYWIDVGMIEQYKQAQIDMATVPRGE